MKDNTFKWINHKTKNIPNIKYKKYNLKHLWNVINFTCEHEDFVTCIFTQGGKINQMIHSSTDASKLSCSGRSKNYCVLQCLPIYKTFS